MPSTNRPDHPSLSSLGMIALLNGPFHTAAYMATALLCLPPDQMVPTTQGLIDGVAGRMTHMGQPAWHPPSGATTESGLNPPWLVCMLDAQDLVVQASTPHAQPYPGLPGVTGARLVACLCALAFEEAVCGESSQHRAILYPDWPAMFAQGAVPRDWFAQWSDQTDQAIQVWRWADTVVGAHPALAVLEPSQLYKPGFVRTMQAYRDGYQTDAVLAGCTLNDIDPPIDPPRPR